ncbi:MAG: hypothetical protein U0936_23880 [Planctomycetaceae bacterium]
MLGPEFRQNDTANRNVDSLQESPTAKRAAQLNGQTRILQTYGHHQQKTMELVLSASTEFDTLSGRSVSVLGAGNCMDLDLSLLASLFEKVNLLDIDRAALETGVKALTAVLLSRLQIIAPVDLAFPLATATASELSDNDRVEQMCRKLEAPLAGLPVSPADVVVSTCVLSQMISAVSQLVTDKHPRFLSLIQAVRRGHLVRILQMLKPGGRGILISDLVSSESTPEMTSIGDSDLPQLLAQALAQGNFFSGLHPGVMLQDLKSSPEIAGAIEASALTAPWRWQMGPRTYAVYAVTFRKK